MLRVQIDWTGREARPVTVIKHVDRSLDRSGIEGAYEAVP